MRNTRHRPHWVPDAVVYELEQFRDWMFAADHGERCLYHIGMMMVDQENRPNLKDLGDYAALMADCGAISITQKRIGEGMYQYYACRTDKPCRMLPRAVAMGEINVRIYLILRAIHTRENRVSAKKAIRDAVTITEAEATKVLQMFVDAGMVNKGKPPATGPYLEKSGLEVLK